MKVISFHCFKIINEMKDLTVHCESVAGGFVVAIGGENDIGSLEKGSSSVKQEL